MRQRGVQVLATWARQIRLHQSVKNLLVFVPVLTAHQLLNVAITTKTLTAFFALTLVASGNYIWNDLRDLKDDRTHPTKKFRPLAAGQITPKSALFAAVTLVIGGLLLSASINQYELLCVVAYLCVTSAYTIKLKTIPLLDVLTLALLYALRVFIGGVAGSIHISVWLILFSLFVFFSLALMKRYAEFTKYSGEVYRSRGYASSDKELIRTLGVSGGLIAALVLGLWLNSPLTKSLYSQSEVLWLEIPVFLYWITRLWMLTERGLMNDDPVAFALFDRPSQIVAGTSLLIGIVSLLI